MILTNSWLQLAQASQLALPEAPPMAVQETISEHGLGWQGHIITRIWPADFTEEDYRAMLLGSPYKQQRYGRVLSDYEWRALAKLLDHECLDGFEVQNIACNAGRTVILNWISLVAGQTGCNYFAVGTGTGTVAATDTQLFTEGFRKSITSSSVSGNQVDFSTFFAAADANFTFTEAGLFGNGATGTANSGTLFTHAAYSYAKTNTVTLTSDYFVSFN